MRGAASETRARGGRAKSGFAFSIRRCSDAFVLATNEGVQIHGGIGMTEEHDAGFYLKRTRVAEMTFGDAAWHCERWARQRGY